MSVKTHISVAGVGSHVPPRRLTNAQLAPQLGVTPEWIEDRTGIRERCLAAEGHATSDMAVAAARDALADAGLAAHQLDLLLVATCTADMPMPSTACLVQQALGATGAACMDIQAACNGFVSALHTARGMMLGGLHRNVLVIGADKMSSLISPTDRNTRVLFGDGAGAVVLRATDAPGSDVLHTLLRSDGALWNLITVPGGGSRTPLTPARMEDGLAHMHMKGREVFRHAVASLSSVVKECLAAAGVDPSQVALCIPHQSNARIVSAVADRLGWTANRVLLHLAEVGNTGAASIPMALHHALASGKAMAGDLVVLAGVGAGMTWGAALVRL